MAEQDCERVPSGLFSPKFEASIGGDGAPEVDGEGADDGDVFRAVSTSKARLVVFSGNRWNVTSRTQSTLFAMAQWPMWASHLGSAPGSSQTGLPFKRAARDESLTAGGGLALFAEYLRAIGVCGLIDHVLPDPGRAAGYGRSAHVATLVLMLAGGGRTLDE